jgi:hypothetical protein
MRVDNVRVFLLNNEDPVTEQTPRVKITADPNVFYQAGSLLY